MSVVGGWITGCPYIDENEKKNKLKNDKDAKKIAKIAKNIMNGKLRK